MSTSRALAIFSPIRYALATLRSLRLLFVSWLMFRTFGYDAAHVVGLERDLKKRGKMVYRYHSACHTMAGVIRTLRKERDSANEHVTNLISDLALEMATSNNALAARDEARAELSVYKVAMIKAAPKVATRRKHLAAAREECDP